MTKQRNRFVAGLVGLALLVGLVQLGKPAGASFPGTNGLIAYVQGGNIFLIDPQGAGIPQQITNAGNFNNVAFNAAANQLAAEDASGVVFLNPVAGSPVTQLPGGNNADDDPNFNPAGTRVTFENGDDIFVQDITGANRTNISAANGTADREPEWSADGTFIAYENATDFNIYRIAPTGGAPTRLTPAAAGCAAATPCEAPTTSPSNANVGYDQDGAAVNGIYQVLSSGASASALRLSVGNDDNPSYSPDGNRVAFDNGASNIAFVQTDGSQVTTIFTPGTDPSWGRAAGGGASPTPTPPPPNVNPVLTCPAAAQVPAIPGTASVNVSGTDANAGQTVTITKTSGPGTLSAPPGNPSNGTLTLNATIVDWFVDFGNPTAFADTALAASDGAGGTASCTILNDVVLFPGFFV